VDRGEERLDRRIPYTAADMVSHAPVTHVHLAEGAMDVESLCKAVVEVSDNPAANLLLKTLGGPEGLTAYARALDDATTRLDRFEIDLNTALPGDPRDTTSPAAMAGTLRKLVLGEALSAASRRKLTDWMAASTTGLRRLRQTLPQGWRAADKTGTGGQGSTNDIAVFWPPSGAPILVAAYLTETTAPLDVREGVLADVGALAVKTFATGAA
jgi:beta-lactamase class A